MKKDITPTNVALVEKEVNVVIIAAKQIQISDLESANAAVDFLKRIKKAKKWVNDLLDSQCKSAYETWQVALAKKNGLMKPLDEAEKIVKGEKTRFDKEQLQLREKLLAEARERAEKEEEKERNRILKRIEKTNDEEKKAFLREQFETVHVPIDPVLIEPIKVDGATLQSDYSVEIVNPMELLKAITSGLILINVDKLITFKIGCLKDYIKLTGATLIPGCKVEKTFIQRIT